MQAVRAKSSERAGAENGSGMGVSPTVRRSELQNMGGTPMLPATPLSAAHRAALLKAMSSHPHSTTEVFFIDPHGAVGTFGQDAAHLSVRI